MSYAFSSAQHDDVQNRKRRRSQSYSRVIYICHILCSRCTIRFRWSRPTRRTETVKNGLDFNKTISVKFNQYFVFKSLSSRKQNCQYDSKCWCFKLSYFYFKCNKLFVTTNFGEFSYSLFCHRYHITLWTWSLTKYCLCVDTALMLIKKQSHKTNFTLE